MLIKGYQYLYGFFYIGLYLDAQAALEFLLNRQDIDNEKIIIYGRSLGGAVAIDLAINDVLAEHIFALIVENTFTSIPDMACHMFSWIKRLPTVFYRNQVGFISVLFCRPFPHEIF